MLCQYISRRLFSGWYLPARANLPRSSEAWLALAMSAFDHRIAIQFEEPVDVDRLLHGDHARNTFRDLFLARFRQLVKDLIVQMLAAEAPGPQAECCSQYRSA